MLFLEGFEMTKTLIGGKTIEEWDTLWEAVPGALSRRHPQLKMKVGVLRFTLHGEIMYIGKAVEEGPGFFKRLYDFHRVSTSARDDYGPEKIYEHRDKVAVDVIVVESGWLAPNICKELRDAMIDRHKPLWNQTQETIDAAIEARRAHIDDQQIQAIKTVSAADVVI